jgi:hypothetical protein
VSQRRFAAPGRAKEYDRAEPIGAQQPAQELALAEKMLLADELVERPRPHSRRQWLGAPRVFFMHCAK